MFCLLGSIHCMSQHLHLELKIIHLLSDSSSQLIENIDMFTCTDNWTLDMNLFKLAQIFYACVLYLFIVKHMHNNCLILTTVAKYKMYVFKCITWPKRYLSINLKTTRTSRTTLVCSYKHVCTFFSSVIYPHPTIILKTMTCKIMTFFSQPKCFYESYIRPI